MPIEVLKMLKGISFSPITGTCNPVHLLYRRAPVQFANSTKHSEPGVFDVLMADNVESDEFCPTQSMEMYVLTSKYQDRYVLPDDALAWKAVKEEQAKVVAAVVEKKPQRKPRSKKCGTCSRSWLNHKPQLQERCRCGNTHQCCPLNT